MDRNFFLAMALSFLVLVTWSMYAERSQPPSAPPQSPREAGVEEAPPSAAQEPAWPSPRPTEEPLRPAGPSPSESATPERRIAIQAPLWNAELSSKGGTLVRWELAEYVDRSVPGDPTVEMTTLGAGLDAALTTSFQELGLGDLSRADYEVEQPDAYTLVFRRSAGAIGIRKTYRFDPDAYVFRLQLEVENGSERTLRPTFRTAWPAVHRESADYREFWLSAYAQGDLEQAAVAGGGGFLLFGGGGGLTDPVEFSGELDWAGARTRYFLVALMPDVPRQAAARFAPVDPGEAATVEVAFHAIDVPPGQRAERHYQVYLGPKEPDRLDAVGGHLDEAILKGWFPSLTRFFTWLLTATHAVVPNYGVAIILITVLVRVLMAPVMARQMRSMKRLSALQPKIKEVQEKYPDDRQKQSEAMMAVYRDAGMSPFSAMTGCFPMLLQLPVFIGFYYALQGAIQLRQQPFVAWISDLSEPEALFVIPGLELPVRVLPLLMGGSMVLQQRLTPTAMDPAQARMMMTLMPVMFTLLFYQFASGLVLYWLVSNLLGIAQQVITNRRSDA